MCYARMVTLLDRTSGIDVVAFESAVIPFENTGWK